MRQRQPDAIGTENPQAVRLRRIQHLLFEFAFDASRDDCGRARARLAQFRNDAGTVPGGVTMTARSAGAFTRDSRL